MQKSIIKNLVHIHEVEFTLKISRSFNVEFIAANTYLGVDVLGVPPAVNDQDEQHVGG